MTYFTAPGIRQTDRKLPMSIEEYFSVILEYVCKKMMVPSAAVLKKGKKGRNVEVRHVVAFLLYEWRMATLTCIGELLQGERSSPFGHTSVLHAVGTIRGRLSVKDEKLKWLPDIKRLDINCLLQ